MSINVSAPVNSLGYGIVGLNLVKGLDAIGKEPAIWFIGQPEIPQNDIALLSRSFKRQETFDHKAPSVRLYHQFDLAQHIGSGVRCGFPIFELTRFKSKELVHLNSQDAIIVASEWAAGIVRNCCRDGIRVGVAPLGVDRTIFRPSKPTIGGTTRFLNCGKWELRKGHDILCDAFNLAFTDKDDVELTMHCHNPCFADQNRYLACNSQWESFYKESKLGSKIRVSSSRFQSQQQLAKLMSEADCGVFPSRAEGWNLDAAEMLAMGKKLIITNYSAHTEFCNADNSLLIDCPETEDAHDGIWFNAADLHWNRDPGKWAKLEDNELDSLVEHMRSVHKAKQEGANLFNQAGVESMAKFTWENTVRRMCKFIENLS